MTGELVGEEADPGREEAGARRQFEAGEDGLGRARLPPILVEPAVPHFQPTHRVEAQHSPARERRARAQRLEQRRPQTTLAQLAIKVERSRLTHARLTSLTAIVCVRRGRVAAGGA